MNEGHARRGDAETVVEGPEAAIKGESRSSNDPTC